MTEDWAYVSGEKYDTDAILTLLSRWHRDFWRWVWQMVALISPLILGVMIMNDPISIMTGPGKWPGALVVLVMVQLNDAKFHVRGKLFSNPALWHRQVGRSGQRPGTDKQNESILADRKGDDHLCNKRRLAETRQLTNVIMFLKLQSQLYRNKF